MASYATTIPRVIAGAALGHLLAAAVLAQTTMPAALQDAPPNGWVKIADHGPGPRVSFALVYAPIERAFVCVGGHLPAGSASEMSLELARGRWENRLPPGRQGVWGDVVGPIKPPAFPRGSVFKDQEGTVRPNLEAGYYSGMWTWGNWALDEDRGTVVCYWAMLHSTAEYDLAGRTWKVVTTPPEHPQRFRDAMLFGSMCYDPVNKEVMGGQGGWIYANERWRQLKLGSPLINELRTKAESWQRAARKLAGAARARFYLAESEQEAKQAKDNLGRRNVPRRADGPFC